jgi:uncharacterized membrane protein YbhN (UPF0104 family)
MNKYVLLGIFFVIFVAGLGVIFSNQSVSFGEVLGSLSDLNPRVLSLIALPVIAVLFGLGVYLRKQGEARMWKNAMLKTRAKSSTEKRDQE